MNLLIIFFVAVIEYAIADVISDNSKSTYQVLVENGYPVEIYNLKTSDGYILQVHRVPRPGGKPIFLMHGLLGSSYDWIALGTGKGFAYCLFAAGYDVWMGNARGNTYSKSKTNMTSSQIKNYWKFSWHEIGYYDLPTMIDFVLATTKQSSLVYIGFSQGTTAFFVMTSTRPEYNNKIRAMFGLGPVAFVNHGTNFLAKLATLASVPVLSLLYDDYEFLPSTKVNALLGGILCEDGAPTQYLCSSLLFVLLGVNREQLNDTMLPTILGHTPAGASTRQIIHYGQSGLCGCFGWYDYGLFLNLIHYQSSRPPQYNLSLITVPVYLFSGAKDSLSNQKDVDRLLAELGNPMKQTHVSDPNWEHVDFIYGKDARTRVYEPVMDKLRAVFNN